MRPFSLRNLLLIALMMLTAAHLLPELWERPALAGKAAAAGEEASSNKAASSKDASSKDAATKASAEASARPSAATGTAPVAAVPATPAISISRPAIPAGGNVAIIPIEGMIYDFTLESLQRRVDRALLQGADVIVFEINTNGGLSTAAEEIARFIRGKVTRNKANIPTVAWINDKAYSAGILIASACDRVVMAPAAVTGDCAPITMFGNLAPAERAKALSPLLAEFKANAEDNGYPRPLLYATAVLDVKLYIVEHKSDKDDAGQPLRKLVNQIDYQIMVLGKSRSTLSEAAESLVGDDPSVVGSPSREQATDADRGQWKLVEEAHDGKTLLTIHAKDAVKLGLAETGTFRDDEDIAGWLGANMTFRVSESWSEGLAGWLVSMPVRAVLIGILLICTAVEMLIPGYGIFGMVALGALAILIISPFLVGLAEVWHLLLVGAGLIALFIEVFVTPGFGVIGIGGIVAILAGLILSVVPTTGDGPLPLPAPQAVRTLQSSIIWSLLGLTVGSVAFILLLRNQKSMPLFSRLTLKEKQRAMTSAVAPIDTTPVEDPAIASVRQHIAGDDAWGQAIEIGATGRVTSELKPLGRANIAGQVIEVTSTGGWIEVGRSVRVVQIEGSKIVVDLV